MRTVINSLAPLCFCLVQTPRWPTTSAEFPRLSSLIRCLFIQQRRSSGTRTSSQQNTTQAKVCVNGDSSPCLRDLMCTRAFKTVSVLSPVTLTLVRNWSDCLRQSSYVWKGRTLGLLTVGTSFPILGEATEQNLILSYSFLHLFLRLLRLSRAGKAEPPVSDPPRLPAEELQPVPAGVHLRDPTGHRRRCVPHETMVRYDPTPPLEILSFIFYSFCYSLNAHVFVCCCPWSLKNSHPGIESHL